MRDTATRNEGEAGKNGSIKEGCAEPGKEWSSWFCFIVTLIR